MIPRQARAPATTAAHCGRRQRQAAPRSDTTWNRRDGQERRRLEVGGLPCPGSPTEPILVSAVVKVQALYLASRARIGNDRHDGSPIPI